ncbi:MAG TPA: thiamine pyrophosphate-dependent enzyme [Xanthobacteraceae bacterium]|nr:thiamine pyrophosphate-dependent enzyme [Xanthobacteraceae bacterium]
MSGGDAVVRSLMAHGIASIYCLPGVQSDHLFNALFDAGDGINAVHTRHEQGAAYMALGAALATGRPAAYSVVPGPGFLNSTAALATAQSTGAKVLALIGQIPSRRIGKGRGYLHEIPDQLGILRTLTKWADRVERPADAPGLVARAFHELASGRVRPVGLELPPDMLARQEEVELVAPLPAEPPAPLDEDAIAQAAAALDAAECPLIFVGGGALDAAPEVRALAERLTAPVVGYRRGKGVLDNRHVLSHALPAGHALWAEADVVLAVGTRMFIPFGAWGTDDKLKIIKVDIDAAEHDRWPVPVTGLTGDAAAILRRLDGHLGHHAPMDAKRVAASRALKARVADDLAGLGVMRDYLQAIRDVLPDDGVLVDELTQVGYAARVAYEARGPRTYVSSGYQGTLGWGLATALGAKHALGKTPVVSITGDGGFMFNVQELATAVRHRIPLVVVLFNDGAYGNVRNMQRHDHGNRVIATDLANPDFMRLAASFGIGGYRASDPGGLRVALERALAQDEPALIEVPCGTLPDPWRFIDLPKVRGV